MLTLREVTKQVRELNEAFDGPGGISLHSRDDGERVAGYEFHEGEDREYGYEELPGDGRRVDCVGVARRLLAAFRDRRIGRPGDDTCPCGQRYGEYGHDH